MIVYTLIIDQQPQDSEISLTPRNQFLAKAVESFFLDEQFRKQITQKMNMKVRKNHRINQMKTLKVYESPEFSKSRDDTFSENPTIRYMLLLIHSVSSIFERVK
jgi:hypothetical protein